MVGQTLNLGKGVGVLVQKRTTFGDAETCWFDGYWNAYTCTVVTIKLPSGKVVELMNTRSGVDVRVNVNGKWWVYANGVDDYVEPILAKVFRLIARGVKPFNAWAPFSLRPFEAWLLEQL